MHYRLRNSKTNHQTNKKLESKEISQKKGTIGGKAHQEESTNSNSTKDLKGKKAVETVQDSITETIDI